MNDWILHDPVTGAGVQTMRNVPRREAEATAIHLGLVLAEADGDQTDATHYLLNGRHEAYPPKTTPRSEWNWPTRQWTEPPRNHEEEYAKKVAEIKHELDRRTAAPIVYAGIGFDADDRSHGRIAEAHARIARGDGLPGSWTGWRAFDNTMQWASDPPPVVRGHFAALLRAIEDRKQAHLVAFWHHKEVLAAMTDATMIMEYDAAAGWPV